MLGIVPRVTQKTMGEKLESDICKIVPVPSGDIDFRLIKVRNWFNSSRGMLKVKANDNKKLLWPHTSLNPCLSSVMHFQIYWLSLDGKAADNSIFILAKAVNIKASLWYGSTDFHLFLRWNNIFVKIVSLAFNVEQHDCTPFTLDKKTSTNTR